MRVREDNRLNMIILLWFLWTERNLVREEGRRRSADTLARSIRLYAAEISKQQEKKSSSSVKSKQQWSRPLEGIVKLNCDASFKADSKTGSWGFIICDHKGDVVLTGRGRINHLLSVN